jgi:hypothetical protein
MTGRLYEFPGKADAKQPGFTQALGFLKEPHEP